jgi:hypothetical protein
MRTPVLHASPMLADILPAIGDRATDKRHL